MSKKTFRAAVAGSIVVSVAAVCWSAINIIGYSLAKAFRSAPAGTTAWIILWLACAGLALTLTWEIVARYRRAFPKRDRRGQVS